MVTFRILLALLCLAFVLPKAKLFIKKKEVDFWDLMIVFSSYFYCAIPAVYMNTKDIIFNYAINWDVYTAVIYFFVVATFLFSLQIVGFIWKKHNGNRNNILNITLFLKNYGEIKISKYIFLIVAFVLWLVLTIYIPFSSYVARIEGAEDLMEANYVQKSLVAIIQKLYLYVFSMTIFLYFKVKNVRDKKMLGICIVLFFVETVFLPRRVLMFYLIIIFLIFYSVKRELITKQFYTRCFTGVILIWLLYFPFYNVMRYTTVELDMSHPIESLSNIIDDAMNRWGEDNSYASNMSKSRTLGLVFTMWRLIEYDENTSYGGVLIQSISASVPKLIYPNKDVSPEGDIEKRTRINVDCSDSWLLYSYADFAIFGGIACTFFIVLVSGISLFELKLNSIVVKYGSLFDFFIVVSLVSHAWNVEGKYEGVFVSLFQIIIPISFYYLIYKLRIVHLVK